MYKKIRSLIFKLNPEDAHALSLDVLNNTRYIFGAQWLLKQLFKTPPKPVEAFGITFPNPVGLAAGYDKNAAAFRSLSMLGFGHIEVGTVTPLAQSGNSEPRVFCLPEDEAIINRMGFPSHGSARVVKTLDKIGHCQYPTRKSSRVINLKRFFPESRAKYKSEMILGVNIGKNTNTSAKEAIFDYLSLLELFAPCADYFTINMDAFNTAGLQNSPEKIPFAELLKELDYQRKHEQKRLRKKIPLLVKLSPNLSDVELEDALDPILATGIDGIVATNSTVARDGLQSAKRYEKGQLSGSPLRVTSEALLRQIIKKTEGKIPIISSGGIMSAEDAKRRLDMGATLIQVYTGLIYNGPGFVKEILQFL